MILTYNIDLVRIKVNHLPDIYIKGHFGQTLSSTTHSRSTVLPASQSGP